MKYRHINTFWTREHGSYTGGAYSYLADQAVLFSTGDLSLTGRKRAERQAQRVVLLVQQPIFFDISASEKHYGMSYR
jgi:hypothetical protein